MFAVSEVAPNGPQNGQTQSQQQVIASVVALQRVIAGQSSAEGGDASSRNFSAEKGKTPVPAERKPLVAKDATEKARDDAKTSAEAKSIIEAQEASSTDTTIVAAFQARHGLTDLLSVIRDPEDRMLPSAPES